MQHKTEEHQEKWLFEIKPKDHLFRLNISEIWRYRDLVTQFVRRDVVTLYKQTILGPLWYFIQPLFTMVIFTIVFNNLAGISTGNIPSYLFNLAGIISWNYFSSALTETSDTFKKNENIFGKVYFPRIIMPLSTVISNLLKYGIQLLIFIGFYLYYTFIEGLPIRPDITILFLPFLILIMAMLGLGLGMIFSAMVTKYRDLTFLLNFGVQLLMYISAVFYPLDLVSEKLPKYAWVVKSNPMAYIIEIGRYMFLGVGHITINGVLYTIGITFFIFIFGLLIFNKTEKTFIDTV
jgi:lipopolysaccharide transport system permease protein